MNGLVKLGLPYTAEGYQQRAEECVKLANQTSDAMVQSELLKLRQTYLKIVERLSARHAPCEGQPVS